MREEILRQGGEVKFACRLDSLLLRMGAVEGGILVETGKDPETFLTNTILLAIGHSARDTMRSLFGQGIRMVQKPFAVGVRIEHPQEMISRSQYGGAWNHPALGPAPYKLSVRTPDGRGVYTFCMCPGGEVIAAASQPEGVAVNGMSRHDRGAANANAALLTGIRPDDFGDSHPLAGFAFQRSMERAAWRSGGGAYQAPAQRVEDFLQGKASSRFGDVVPSYRPGVTPADLRSCLPGFVTDNLKLGILEMDRQLHGFAMADAVLTGVETRSSSPVRLPRDQRMMAEAFDGLFPVGEGAGYAGGIVSAAVDGINAAIAACERSAI